jgi:hypothetical protein
MATKVFVFYNLKEGVDLEEFKKWSRAVDQPICNSMEACHSFEVFLVQGEATGKPFQMVVENIDVDSWEAWQDTMKLDAFSKINDEWPRFGDADSAIAIYCEKI